MGDFYEMFFRNAEIASRTLKTSCLTSAASITARHPDVRRTVVRARNISPADRRRHRVAVCEQTEDPAEARSAAPRRRAARP